MKKCFGSASVQQKHKQKPSYCLSSPFDEEDSEVKSEEIRGLEPYQFEPKLADDDESAGLKTLIINAKDLEHWQDYTECHTFTSPFSIDSYK